MTGADLDRLDETTGQNTVHDVSVYARVAPEHRLDIVDALQADGNVVATRPRTPPDDVMSRPPRRLTDGSSTPRRRSASCSSD